MPDTKPLRKPIPTKQFPKVSYGRKTAFLDLAELRTERKIISTIESPHSGKAIDTYQIVERKQSSYRSLLLHRYNLLTSQQQRSPPNDPAKHPRNIQIYLSPVAYIAVPDNYSDHRSETNLRVFSKHPSLRVKQQQSELRRDSQPNSPTSSVSSIQSKSAYTYSVFIAYSFFEARSLVFKLKFCKAFPNLSSLTSHRISSSSCRTYSTRKYIPIATIGAPFSIRNTVNGEQVPVPPPEPHSNSSAIEPVLSALPQPTSSAPIFETT